MGETGRLAHFTANLKYDHIPAAVLEKMKLCLLDSVGCALAGSNREDISIMLEALSPYYGDGGVAVFGRGQTAPLPLALLLNSTMCHVLEMDDLHKASKVHPGCIVATGILSYSCVKSFTGADALAAMTAGYEAMIRLGEGMGTVSHRKRGWHATATCGAIGMAAAMGNLMRLPETQLANALGLAGSQAAGLMAFLADGSSGKRFQVGKAALNGWMAAQLASGGLTGPASVLEASDGGLLHAMSDCYDLSKIDRDLGKRFLAEEVGIKLHACCGHTHQAIDAVYALRERHSFSPDDIESVEVRVYDVSGVSWGAEGMPKNAVEGQFNFPYVVALALLEPQVSLAQFAPEYLSDQRIHHLSQKIRVLPDPAYTARYPAEWCASVTIRLRGGEALWEEAVGAKGDWNKPLTYREAAGKFDALTGGILSPERQNAIHNAIYHLEALDDVKELVALLQ